MALTELIRRRLSGIEDALVKALLDKYQTLGGRAQLLVKIDALFTLPDLFQRNLLTVRNKVVHEAFHPTRTDALAALRVAEELAQSAHPLDVGRVWDVDQGP